jgi:Xaa-Pro aminopeptidase
VDECSAADELERLRSAQPGFVSLSFDTISGADANGAIIHYKPQAATCAPITPSSLYLLDSGGQYSDGTTDVTRTVHMGEPTAHQKRCFTRVLQGHIQLAEVLHKLMLMLLHTS